MKKVLKILGVITLSIFILILCFAVYLFALSFGVKIDESKLSENKKTIVFCYENGEIIEENNGTNSITAANDIPDHVKNAFIAIEDKRFYSHKGIDFKGIMRATFNNVKSVSLKEGASTITQQLIKNTQLTNEKTLKRKVAEIKMAIMLEKKYSKNDILNMYLNTIYFGGNCYGITSASEYYFNKSPKNLTVSEGATLAGIIKAPSSYSPFNNYQKCLKRRNTVLHEMFSQGYLKIDEYNQSVNESLTTVEAKQTYDYADFVKKEFDKIVENGLSKKRNLKVITYCDKKIQDLTKENIVNQEKINNSIVITDTQAHLKAFGSTCNPQYRNLGSVIKPLLVYAPAIETNQIASCSLINDEKTDFGGYSPKNYGDEYFGNISAKTALAKSSNVSAVKILNSIGIEIAKNYVNKTAIELNEKDDNLCIALGSTQKGAMLTDIVSSYTVFPNRGLFNKTKAIKKIIDETGNVIYENKDENRRVFSYDTAFILNDMLKETVTNGTARKLKSLNFPVCAKTGTAGSESGNTDAYSVSYNGDFVIGVWFGNAENELMPNSITGGNQPTATAASIWNNIYDSVNLPSDTFVDDRINKVDIDLISYNEGKIEIADDNAPERYKRKEYIKAGFIIPFKSNRFSHPTIQNAKISLNNRTVNIELCQTEYTEIKIIKTIKGRETCIYDSKINGKKEIISDVIKPNEECVYTVIPYYENEEKSFIGEKQVLPKIKSSEVNSDDWINDDLD